MDRKKSVLNVGVSIAFKVLLLVGALLTRRFLIQYVGNDANGLNSLYANIIGFLAVADLGAGVAIAYCMYKPIVEGDEDKVAAIYRLFVKLYYVVGGIIFVAGLIVMPFLPYLVKDLESTDINLYVTFFLSLVAVVITYLFSAKTSLINAYKNNYVTTTIASTCVLLQYGLQIAVVVLTRSYTLFLACTVLSSLLQWGATEWAARRKYGAVLKNKANVSAEDRQNVVKNIKAVFMHRIGGVLVNTVDSVIISAFIGVAVLGKYSNYTVIMTAMTGIISLFFSPLTSVIGHLFVEEGEESAKRYFNFFYGFNFCLGVVFFLGYYAIIDNLVTLCFGENLELVKPVSFVITFNYFVQFMRQSTLLFRDAAGTFYADRWRPIVEGLSNLALSLFFVWIFPEEYNVVGVIAATIVTNLTINYIIEPRVLYKYAFHASSKGFFVKHYLYVLLFAAGMVGLHFAMRTFENQWLELVVNGFISVGFSLVICAFILLIDKDFRTYAKARVQKIKAKLLKR